MRKNNATAPKGQYTDWANLDYKPVMKEILLDSLLPYLETIDSALDIGCSKGWASGILAAKGINVTAINLNPTELEQIPKEIRQHTNTHFVAGDILTDKTIAPCDLVLLIRVLTCFPRLQYWQQLLKKAYQLVKPQGLIFIHDFLLSPGPAYSKRYRQGEEKGWREGNFEVTDDNNNTLFVAHHHTREELNTITAPYETLKMEVQKSLSMNGNEVRVFQFIGRKRTQRR